MNKQVKKISRKTTDWHHLEGISLPERYSYRYDVFSKLMPFRVREILLVSSLYDSYILEEDGRLTDLIASEYQTLNLPYAPNVTRVSTGEQALERLVEKKYDLVITQMRLGYMDPHDFARAVKEKFPQLPVVMLAYETRELNQILERGGEGAFDKVFVWHGDGKILLAIVKYVEDVKNSEHDIKQGGVPAIILVEDSVAFYSSYLPIIYTELVKQIHTVIQEEPALSRKFKRTRARPKVLLASTFEEGWSLFQEYHDNLLGIISDLRFPAGGKVSGTAGLDFARKVRAVNPDMPILLQSKEEDYASEATALHVAFVMKNSRSLLQEVQSFIVNSFGFGDFVFCMPDGREVGRASNLLEMERMLGSIPPESIKWHGERHHFSRWLMARTEFELARLLRGYDVTGFESIEKVRSFLINSLANLCREAHAGVVTNYSTSQCHEHNRFVRIGGGSLGGKARGLAFMHSLMDRYGVGDRFEGVHIGVPRTAVLATDIFDDFLDDNNLRNFALSDVPDHEIVKAFVLSDVKFDLPPDLEEYITRPVAIRSSSLLEDALYQPFAGTYATLMLPNNDPDRDVRREQLSQAIRYVYASAYFHNAKAYVEATPNRVEEEKMAVVIQELVGNRFGDLFYPHIGGTARSYNYYPVGPQRPDDGVAQIVLGLGIRVVEGKLSLRFSPAHPQVIGQFSNVTNTIKNSQKQFSALDMNQPFLPDHENLYSNLAELDLSVAEEHGTLWPAGSIYSRENDRIYEGIGRKGVKLVTFAHILKTEIFPLARILELLLNLGRAAMSCPVEIEFAVNLEPSNGGAKQFGFLQLRPLVVGHEQDEVDVSALNHDSVFCYCTRTLGNGRIADVQDIIFVKPDAFDASQTRVIAGQVGNLNKKLKAAGSPYLLIGPGRWGSSDSWLGIPVVWSQISAARVIIETSLDDFVVEPSQGSHFFQNLTAFSVGYFSLNPLIPEDRLEWDWLGGLDLVEETEYLKHVALPKPLDIRIDGRTGNAAIIKPGASSI